MGFETYEGLGVKGRAEERDIYIGNRELMALHGVELEDGLDREAETWETMGRTCIFFSWGNRVQGMLVFGDPLRAGAAEFVTRLHAKGIKVWLVSGDGESTTKSAARSAGIRDYKGQVLPDGKVDLIRNLRDQGHRVAMIGDGINDAPALATADVGCAFGANADVVREASDITFVSPDLGKFFEALELSALMSKTIRQNLFFAFFYNAVALPLAAMGLLNPLIAVLAMIGSSLTVTGNALRISRRA